MAQYNPYQKRSPAGKPAQTPEQVKDEVGRVTGYTGLEKIGETLAPIMVRRRKSEVLRQAAHIPVSKPAPSAPPDAGNPQ